MAYIMLYIMAFSVSAFAVIFVMPSIISISERKHLMDSPTEDRKIYTKTTPNIGGVAVFLGFYLQYQFLSTTLTTITRRLYCQHS